MTEFQSGIIGLVLAIVVLLDACVILVSYIYSRFIFNRYLMKHQRQNWEELAYTGEYRGLNWFSFDKTRQLGEFRAKSSEDLGDPRIMRMRKIANYLFRTGILVWVSLLFVLISFGIVALLIR